MIEYYLMWNREEIDCFDDYKEAHRCRKEYELAYKGNVNIFRRTKKEEVV